MKKIIALSLLLILFSCGKNDGSAPNTSSSTDTTSSTGCTTCKIFLSASTDTGGAGVAGFDTLCATDSNNPNDGSTYKALIGASTRQPPSTDWPLKASTAYVQSNGTTPVATTTSGSVFTFPVSNPLNTTFINVWTGLTTTMTPSGTNCLNWTSSANGVTGTYGVSNVSSTSAVSNAPQTCDVAYKVYCVQQ